MMRKGQWKLTLGATLFLMLALTGCSLLESGQFNYLYENATTQISLSRESKGNPVKLFFVHNFPADFAYPSDTSSQLSLVHTALQVSILTANGEVLMPVVRDTMPFRDYERWVEDRNSRGNKNGFNEENRVQHSLVLPYFGETLSGWQSLVLKIEAFPYNYESAPIPGKRMRTTKVTGSQPVLIYEIPFEMKF